MRPVCSYSEAQEPSAEASYGEALTEARSGGAITPAGRLALEMLRESLELDREEAAELESKLEGT